MNDKGQMPDSRMGSFRVNAELSLSGQTVHDFGAGSAPCAGDK